jgi:hypothetical protein
LAAAQAALEEAAQVKPLNTKSRSNGAPKKRTLSKNRLKA